MGNQIPMSFLVEMIEVFPKKHEFKWNKLQEGLFYVVATNDPFLISQSLSLTEIVQIFETPEFVNCNHLLDCLYVWVVRERLQKNGSNGINPSRFPRLWNLFGTKKSPRKKTKFYDHLPTTCYGHDHIISCGENLPKFLVDPCLHEGQPHNDRSPSIEKIRPTKETLVHRLGYQILETNTKVSIR